LFLQETTLRTTADTLPQSVSCWPDTIIRASAALPHVEFNTRCTEFGSQSTENLLDEGVADTLGLVGEAGASITAPMAGEFLARRHAPMAAVFIAPASSL
jgi:hypothetical protein